MFCLQNTCAKRGRVSDIFLSRLCASWRPSFWTLFLFKGNSEEFPLNKKTPERNLCLSGAKIQEITRLFIVIIKNFNTPSSIQTLLSVLEFHQVIRFHVRGLYRRSGIKLLQENTFFLVVTYHPALKTFLIQLSYSILTQPYNYVNINYKIM